MKITVVPNRNMILLSLAIGYAISIKAEQLAYGAHTGDHRCYPDCRPEFVSAMQGATALCDFNPPQLLAPFIHISKAQICRQGFDEDAPLRLSYSCYSGREKHCGCCGTCVERLEAFKIANVPDPTEYEDSETWKTFKAPSPV